MTKIAPSILAGDFANMEKTIKSIETWQADYIHCDVMDGTYVDNISFGQQMLSAIRKITKMPLDVHLMIHNPQEKALSFAKLGADIITFHPDTCSHPHKLLQQIKAENVKAGIVLNPGMSVEGIKYLLELCDIVLLMSVNPGAGGQKFISSTLQKAKELYKLKKALNLDFEIEIDGGVDITNSNEIVNSNVDVLVAGSSIFNAEDPKKYIEALRG